MKYSRIMIILLILLMFVFNNGCNLFTGNHASSTTISAKETDPARELDFTYHVTRETMFSVLKESRTLSSLHELEPRDNGKQVSELTSGTYFFLSPYFLVTSAEDTTRFWSRSIVSRFEQFIVDYYEVHYVSAKKIDLIAFVTEDDAYKLHKLNGHTKLKVTLAPDPYDAKTNTLVSLPYCRILEAKVHITRSDDGEDMYLLDAIIQ